MMIKLVVWIDSAFIQGTWNTLDDFDFESHNIRSVGYLVKEDDENILLCGSINSLEDNDNNRFGSCVIIPKCSIKQIQDLSITLSPSERETLKQKNAKWLDNLQDAITLKKSECQIRDDK